MRQMVALLLTFTLVFSMTTVAFANEKKEECNNASLVGDVLVIIGDAEINGAPAGVTFGGEVTAQGSYELEGVTVSIAVSALTIAIGVSGIAAFISLGVTTAIGEGASHVYWIKKIAYGEDSQYYYVRTKVRLYSNASHTKPLTDWKTIYTKKSKNNGASEGGETL